MPAMRFESTSGRAESEQLLQVQLAGHRVVGALDAILRAGRAEHRNPIRGLIRAVAQCHYVGRHVDAVIGMQVGQDDRVDLTCGDAGALQRTPRRGVGAKIKRAKQ